MEAALETAASLVELGVASKGKSKRAKDEA